MLVDKGRLELSADIGEWLESSIAPQNFLLQCITPRIALESTRLSAASIRDPSDQLIAATAIALDATLITKDKLLRRVRAVPTVW